MTGSDRTLDVDGIVKAYGGRRVVDGVKLNVNRGEIVGLLGPNGAGKTTTFSMIVGLMKPDSGAIVFVGKDITGLPMHKRARMGIGYLPQDASVFRKLTVEGNLTAILETMDMTGEELERRRRSLIEGAGLSKLAKQKACTLSGGERRKLEITRALAREPALMMLDEPFSGLDPKAVQDIQRTIREMKGRGIAVLITDHSVRETLSVVDRAYLMYAGKVLREGESGFLLSDEASRDLYLGWEFKM